MSLEVNGSYDARARLESAGTAQAEMAAEITKTAQNDTASPSRLQRKDVIVLIPTENFPNCYRTDSGARIPPEMVDGKALRALPSYGCGRPGRAVRWCRAGARRDY